MRLRLAPFLFAVVAFLPTAAFAQQNPTAPDGTSMNEPPAAGPVAAVDSCGNRVAQPVGGEPVPGPVVGDTPGTPLGTAPEGAPDDTATHVANMSSVRGMLVHADGNLLLLTVPMLPAAGNDNPAPPTPGQTMTVVRLPSDCALPSLTPGEQVSAVGMPTAEGILNAESVLAAE